MCESCILVHGWRARSFISVLIACPFDFFLSTFVLEDMVVIYRQHLFFMSLVITAIPASLLSHSPVFHYLSKLYIALIGWFRALFDDKRSYTFQLLSHRLVSFSVDLYIILLWCNTVLIFLQYIWYLNTF